MRAASPGTGRLPFRNLCAGATRAALGSSQCPGSSVAPLGDTFIWEVVAVQLRKPGWGLPHPITSTSLCLKPQCHSLSATGRSAKRDCSYQIGGMSCPCGYWHAGRMGWEEKQPPRT